MEFTVNILLLPFQGVVTPRPSPVITLTDKKRLNGEEQSSHVDTMGHGD
jgi:hypothetical protein